MQPTTRRSFLALSALGLGVGLSACGSDDSASKGSTSSGSSDAATSGQWPMTVKHALGETVIKSEPKRIVSTSIVLAGGLLAVGAPLVAAPATSPNTPLADEKGFFRQWSKIAEERGVKVLYKSLKLDMEAVQAQKPDLIVISTTGGDSTADNYKQLSAIAPTIALNYNDGTWEEIIQQLGKDTGHSEGAKKALENYEKTAEEVKNAINPPSEPVQAIVAGGPRGAAFAVPDGTYGDIFKKVGITLAPLPEGAKRKKGRNDVAFLSAEATVAGLTAKNILMIGANEQDVKKFEADPAYANIPARKGGKIVPLGVPCFKLDYYSVLDMLEHVKAGYAK